MLGYRCPCGIKMEWAVGLPERDRLYKLAKTSLNNADDWVKARKIRNYCNSCVKKAKENYVKEHLNNHNNDPKKFWSVIETVWNPNKNSNSQIFLVNMVTGAEIKAEDTPKYNNEHLTNVAQNLTQNIPDCPFNDTISSTREEFAHSPITVTEVDKLIKNIKIHKSSDRGDLR